MVFLEKIKLPEVIAEHLPAFHDDDPPVSLYGPPEMFFPEPEPSDGDETEPRSDADVRDGS